MGENAPPSSRSTRDFMTRLWQTEQNTSKVGAWASQTPRQTEANASSGSFCVRCWCEGGRAGFSDLTVK